GAVDEQVRNFGWKHQRLDGRVVEIGDEVDGVEINVGEQFFRDCGHAGFGVPIGGGRIAVDGTEVALTVDERVTQGEILRHANHGVVDGGVAVGVIFAENFTDDLGALHV